MLEAAIADCGAKAEEKNMQVHLACPADLTASINASLLEQAVVNLIENALVYSPTGQTVEVSALAADGEIEIRVRDYGCGISREHLPRIFERSTASTSRGAATPAARGWGWPSSSTSSRSTAAAPPSKASPGKGSTFSIFLPR